MKKLLLLLALFAPLFSYSQIITTPSNPKGIDPNRIDIVRDSFGVAHVFAPTDAEVAYGLAWATAEDDFELPQWFLMAITGNMGRYQGVDGAEIDYAVKWMGVNDRVATLYESQISQEFRAVCEGYAEGANAYAKAHPEEVTCKKCFPTTGQDIVTGHMLGLALMAGIDGQIRNILNGNVLNDVPKDPGIGSNGFAFNRQKTTEEEVFLAINSHQPIEGLLSFYEIHACSEEGWNIVGAMFHGSPVIFEGTNEYLGWGHTTGDVDSRDVYQLEMHPKKKKWYKYDGEWRKLKVKREKLVVGLGKKHRFRIPVWKKTWESVYGPTLVTEHGTFAVRMPALMEIHPAEQWYRMNKARNFTEFYRALEMQGIAIQNITYADRNDTIMEIFNGLFPMRPEGYNWKKVVPGNTSATLWTEYHPTSALAQFINPSCGYVFNCNNSAFDAADPKLMLDPANFDPNLGYTHKQTNRSRRFHELMEDYDQQISYQDFKTIKFDHTFPDSMTMLSRYSLMELFRFNPEEHPGLEDAIMTAKNWNRSCDRLDTNAALVMFTVYFMNEDYRGAKKEAIKKDVEARKAAMLVCLEKAKNHMLENFGSINIPLGEAQVHQRGDVEMGISGGPDAIRAVYTQPFEEGKRRMYLGDGYVQMVRFPKSGLPIIESVNAYGSASKPGRYSYSNQMELFVEEEFKPMSLDRDEVYRTAMEKYHPK